MLNNKRKCVIHEIICINIQHCLYCFHFNVVAHSFFENSVHFISLCDLEAIYIRTKYLNLNITTSSYLNKATFDPKQKANKSIY